MRKNIQEIIAASYIMLPDINFLVIVFLLHIKQSKAQRFIEDSDANKLKKQPNNDSDANKLKKQPNNDNECILRFD